LASFGGFLGIDEGDAGIGGRLDGTVDGLLQLAFGRRTGGRDPEVGGRGQASGCLGGLGTGFGGQLMGWLEALAGQAETWSKAGIWKIVDRGLSKTSSQGPIGL
jgi:hypothetical protein